MRLLGPACVAVLPLIVWPGGLRPFSTPKLIWLVLSVAALVTLSSRRRGQTTSLPAGVRWLAVAWAASFVIAAALSDLPAWMPLTLGLAAPAFALALASSRPAARDVLLAQAAGATGCAGVALLQWLGVDPFVGLGWQPPIEGASVRMRVYGTLGNPNFVGVLMAMSVPITVAALRQWTHAALRRALVGGLALQALALVATGSRGAVLGLCAATAAYACLRWSNRVRLGLAGLALFGIVAVASSPARPLETTVAGRLHLWRIVAPQALDAPVAGQGPGAVELRFAEWQRAAARDGVRDRRFAGLTDHVHNDYLEALVERGVPGLLALVAPLVGVVWVVVRVPRPTSAALAGSTAAVIAGAACAFVDFPFARPVELSWWWVALVTAWTLADAERRPADAPSPDA